MNTASGGRPRRLSFMSGHPLPCGLLGAGIDGLTVGGAVDVCVGHLMTAFASKNDQALGHIRRDRLTPLVKGYVPLRSPDASGQLRLGYLQAFSDGFDAVHSD